MDTTNQNPEDGEQNLPEQETVVIPPQNAERVEVPEGFASPALFQKEEEVKEDPAETKSPSRTKTILIIIFVVVFLTIATFSIVQILLDKKFSSIYVDPNQQFGDEFVLNEDDELVGNEEASTCADGQPGISITLPTANQILKPGEQAMFTWNVCGISTNLFGDARVDFFDQETGVEEGSFDLDCLAGLEADKQSIIWDVPPYIESALVGECAGEDVDFADPMHYKLVVSYANSQYEAVSEPFFIDVTEYVYNPPQFSDYAIPLDTDFPRAFFIDEGAPDPLKEQIFPSYFEAPPQFANYYRVFGWNCTDTCPSNIYLIDLRTGDAFEAPESPSRYVDPISLLYINKETDPNNQENFLVTWYLFDEMTKSFELIDTKSCEGTGPESFTDCVQP
jgi:hypothetical protein